MGERRSDQLRSQLMSLFRWNGPYSRRGVIYVIFSIFLITPLFFLFFLYSQNQYLLFSLFFYCGSLFFVSISILAVFSYKPLRKKIEPGSYFQYTLSIIIISGIILCILVLSNRILLTGAISLDTEILLLLLFSGAFTGSFLAYTIVVADIERSNIIGDVNNKII